MGWWRRKGEEPRPSGTSERAHGQEDAAAVRELLAQGGGRAQLPGPDGKPVTTYVVPEEPETPPGTRDQRVALIREATGRAAAKGKASGDPVAELDEIAREREIDPELLAFIRDKLSTDPRILDAYPNAAAAVAIRGALVKEGSDGHEPGHVPFTWALQRSADNTPGSAEWVMVPAGGAGVIAGNFDRGGDNPRDWSEAGPVFLQHVLAESGSPSGPFYRLVIWEGTIPVAELDVGRSLAIIYDTVPRRGNS